MRSIDVTVNCPVYSSFRVQQVAGMFDVPLAEKASARFQVNLDSWDDSWKIGLIVGPSGSGKTTIARQMFGDRLTRRAEWANDCAVIDGLGNRPIKEITGLFTAVGFSSPPSWVKPYAVLSNGEQFRCDLARALAQAHVSRGDACDESVKCFASLKCEAQLTSNLTLQTSNSPLSTDHYPIVAFDEFTSVVDRNVARAVSAAIARGIQREQIRCRFVAVTCHYDVMEWLQPDWVIDMATATFQRRSLRRPPIELEIFRCDHKAWSLFKRHHYLSANLNQTARCYLATWNGEPVAFRAVLPLFGKKNRWRGHRLVVLPDYQGLGIGMSVSESIGDLYLAEGMRYSMTASHPAVIAHCRHSPLWRVVSVMKSGGHTTGMAAELKYRSSAGRAVVSFEYIGKPTNGAAA